MLERIAQLSNTAAQRLLVRSALNPALWLCAIVSPTCFFFAWLFGSTSIAQTALLIVGTLPIVVTCLGFGYFALFRPEKLQSEEYQIRHESLQIIQQKAGQISISPASLESIANPAAPQLPYQGADDAG